MDRLKSKPRFDREAIMEILDLQGPESPELVAELVKDFVTYAESLLDDLKTSLKAQQMTDVRQQAHNLRGTSLNMGAARLASICKELEEGTSDPQQLVQNLKDARDEFEGVRDDLTRHVSDLTALI